MVLTMTVMAILTARILTVRHPMFALVIAMVLIAILQLSSGSAQQMMLCALMFAMSVLVPVQFTTVILFLMALMMALAMEMTFAVVAHV